MENGDVKDPIRIAGSSTGRDNNSITISGLTREEQDQLEGMIRGNAWAIVKAGRLEVMPFWNPLPDPVEDPEMYPYWQKPAEPMGTYQMELFHFDSMEINSSPAIYISNLCGYFYSPKNYAEQAAKLRRWGFECLRSQRGVDGKFWEVWYLSGLWAAEEELFQSIRKEDTEKNKLKRALLFLRHNSQYGSLDVVVQRHAMVHPDAMD